MYIDCHAHIFFSPIPKESIDKDIEGEIPEPTIDFINRMISNAKKKGVSRFVGVISNPSDFSRHKEQLQFGNIINIIGISRNNLMEDQSYLISLLKNEIEANIPNGIGEIGLDTYDFDKLNEQEKNQFKIKQQELFAKQIRIAKEFDIPIVVHAGYGTDKDIMNILKQEHANDVGGQIHGYMSKEDLVSELLDQGFYFSFGYIHSREEELKRILEITPPEKMLIETDSPYHLMESPKRFILPEDVIQITKEIAKFKEIEPQDLANIVMKNAKTLFNFS
ncbi:MAG: TatD family hydrolase [Candidatus Hermodarchaeota archaeon]